MKMNQANNGRMPEAHFGNPPEEPEQTEYEFGELLIGAKFWYQDEQWMKVAVDIARRNVMNGSIYEKFNGNEIVSDIT